MVTLLLKYGITNNVLLCCAVLRNYMRGYDYAKLFNLVKLFISYGWSTTSPLSLLNYFIGSGDVSQVQYILEHDTQCNVNAGSEEGNMPLHIACATSLAMVTLILRYHPEVDAQNLTGNTPLRIACIKNDISMVRLLLQHGAKSHLDSSDHSTLLTAVCINNIDMVVLFFQHGANPLQTFDGITLRQLVDVEYTSHNHALVNLLTEAEEAALSTPRTVAATFFARYVLDVRTWSHVLTPASFHAFHHLLRNDEMDLRACYTALHGEEETLRKYRAGKEVVFSTAKIRCLGRSYGTRPIRRRITSYLVFPTQERALLKHGREELHVHGNTMAF